VLGNKDEKRSKGFNINDIELRVRGFEDVLKKQIIKKTNKKTNKNKNKK